MKKEFEVFKTEMDNWVKDFNRKLDNYKPISSMVEEHTDNIDHNYELLHEMRTEIERLKEEVSALRMVQILSLKSEIQKAKRH